VALPDALLIMMVMVMVAMESISAPVTSGTLVYESNQLFRRGVKPNSQFRVLDVVEAPNAEPNGRQRDEPGRESKPLDWRL
jgi:hypothetical protein